MSERGTGECIGVGPRGDPGVRAEDGGSVGVGLREVTTVGRDTPSGDSTPETVHLVIGKAHLSIKQEFREGGRNYNARQK